MSGFSFLRSSLQEAPQSPSGVHSTNYLEKPSTPSPEDAFHTGAERCCERELVFYTKELAPGTGSGVHFRIHSGSRKSLQGHMKAAGFPIQRPIRVVNALSGKQNHLLNGLYFS